MNANELSNAIAWASFHHQAQLDKGGNPYILHPLTVMNKVIHFGFDHAILGVCHDVLEDCFVSLDFGINSFRIQVSKNNDLLNDLLLLTHDVNIPYMDYIKQIAKSERAKRIKMADIEHNTSISRLTGITDKDIKRMEKYCKAYHYLKNN